RWSCSGRAWSGSWPIPTGSWPIARWRRRSGAPSPSETSAPCTQWALTPSSSGAGPTGSRGSTARRCSAATPRPSGPTATRTSPPSRSPHLIRDALAVANASRIDSERVLADHRPSVATGRTRMSGLDQPLLIANSNYHVGQQTSIRVAEEQGFFREEGLAEYVYEWRGLLPGPVERDGLALIMKEHGVDIATAVDVGSILHQRAQGADLYIVGGWRYPPNLKFFAAKHLTDLRQL